MKKCFFVLLLFLCSLQPLQGLAATKVSFNIGNTCRQQAVAKGTYSKQQEKDCWEKERKAADELVRLKDVPEEVFTPCFEFEQKSKSESYYRLLQCMRGRMEPSDHKQ